MTTPQLWPEKWSEPPPETLAYTAAAGLGATGPGPLWSTSCFGHSSDTSPMELRALGSHLLQCQSGNAHLRSLQRATQAVHRFVAPRFVSTLAVLVLCGGALLLY